MPNDPTVQVAIAGILATFITTIGVVFVAMLNNHKERVDSAEEGILATLRERITLRDEQLQDLRAEKREIQMRLDAALENIEENLTLIRHLRAELIEVKGEYT